MAVREVARRHHAHTRGSARAAVLECLEKNAHAELTARDVARLTRLGKRTTDVKLRELRDEGLVHSRMNVTLHGQALLWGRVAV